MLYGSAFANQWEIWDFFNNPDPTLNHVVIFDGNTKTIWILEGISEVSVRTQLYSDWKEWVTASNHSRYEQAFDIEGVPVTVSFPPNPTLSPNSFSGIIKESP